MPFHRIGKNGSRVWGKKGAGIFFTDGRQVLLLKRSPKSDNPNTWGLPGGTAKEGETDIGTATREAKEECGRVEGTRFADLPEKSGHHFWHTFFYKIDKPFECKLSDEHTDSKWVPFDEVDKLDLHPRFKENFDRHKRIAEQVKPKTIQSFEEFLDQDQPSLPS